MYNLNMSICEDVSKLIRIVKQDLSHHLTKIRRDELK